MACKSITGQTSDGTPWRGTICGPRGRKPKPCAYCGKPSSKLCDFVIGYGPGESPSTPGMAAAKTCDKPICGACSVHTEPDTDICRRHLPENKPECDDCDGAPDGGHTNQPPCRYAGL